MIIAIAFFEIPDNENKIPKGKTDHDRLTTISETENPVFKS